MKRASAALAVATLALFLATQPVMAGAMKFDAFGNSTAGVEVFVGKFDLTKRGYFQIYVQNTIWASAPFDYCSSWFTIKTRDLNVDYIRNLVYSTRTSHDPFVIYANLHKGRHRVLMYSDCGNWYIKVTRIGPWCSASCQPDVKLVERPT